jgi:hypothetical protein
MGPEGSLPSSKEHESGPHPETHEPSPQHSLIRKKSDTTQFLLVTIDPTYKLSTGKLRVQFALFTHVNICSF